MDNYDHSWDMSVYRYVFRELHVRHGLQTRVVVLVVHSNFYSRWYIRDGQMMLTFSIYGIRDMPLFSIFEIGVMFKYLITDVLICVFNVHWRQL